MPKTLDLLLTENVENLGIVGDVVNVRAGYARNFLLPRELATEPSEEKIQALAARRAEAERELAELRSQREKMVEKLEGFEITTEQACNDQGLLYGSVTQQDIAHMLGENGFEVRARDVRLTQTIKRIDSYEIVVKPEQDLEATIKLWVVSDRPLDLDRADEAEGAAAEGEAGGESDASAPGGDAAGEEKPAASAEV